MPPVNTPAVTSPTISPPQSHSPVHDRPLTPFSYLSSPAPDLASTLHTQGADAADEANTDFLRDSLEALDQASSQSLARAAFVDAQRDPRLAASAAHTQTYGPRSRQETADDLSRRERLQRVLAHLNRMHEPQAAASDNAYGNRTPSPNRQSLYDWAPGAEDSNDDTGIGAIIAELEELRGQQPETSLEDLRPFTQTQVDERRDSPARTTSYMRVNGTAEPYELLSDLRRRQRQQSLRNRAVLQRARQESSPSATERMLRYVMERERSGMSEEEERARGSGWFRPTPQMGFDGIRDSWLLPQWADDTQDRDRQERVDAFRRGYLAEHAQVRLPRISTLSTPAANSPSQFLENALKYLSDLRACRDYEDALATAMDNNLATKEFFADKHDDFVLDLDDIEEPTPSSWLQPGAVFEGHQHASGANMNITHHRHSQPGTHVEQINPNYRPNENTGPGRIAPYDASRSMNSTNILPDPRLPSPSPKVSDSDHWPVRVTIHSIDWDSMTIQGTMEAYDVPQHSASTVNIVNPGAAAGGSDTATRPKAGRKNAPITTYLEGHIIDQHTHSFLTPPAPRGKTRNSNSNSSPSTLSDTISFPSATARLDAQNWLALPPFNTLTQTPPPTNSTTTSQTAAADTLARLLLSRTQLRALNDEYVFMRWKERCFVHSRHDDCCTSSSADRLGDQDRGHGLTISGFYYVSLRRSDGDVEGLYFDPSSTPYQLLRLRGRAGGWGSFEMM